MGKDEEAVEEVAVEKPKKTKEDVFVVGRVATETQPVIMDRENDEQHDIYSMLARIGNDVQKLLKLL